MDIKIIIIIVAAIFSAIMIGVAYKINGEDQPKPLWMLFFTEMWERFSFYGMRALLMLYMTKVLLMEDTEANLQYGAYNALVYTMPLLGGWVADKILGYRKSIVLGGLLMALGHLVLALPSNFTFFIGLGFLITGNGFFKPNISSLLGTYYTANDPRKDTGYSIFYMGVNIGAFLGSLLCGYLGQEVSWHLGFGVAGFFMIFGLIVFLLNKHILGEKGFEVDTAWLHTVQFGIKKEYFLYLGIFVLVPISVFLVKFHQLTTYFMLPLFIISIVYVIYLSRQFSKEEKEKLWAAAIMIVLTVMFWGFYEQSGGSLNLMADRNVDFTIGSSKLGSAMVNNSLNPFYIVFLTPLLGAFYNYLNKKNKAISIPQKFALSFILVGAGYFMFYMGGMAGKANGMMPFIYFILAYFIITLGELFISPIGLAMITKLSPMKMFGFMMGVFFLASALGHKLAGWIGTMMAIPEKNANGMDFTPVESLPIYMNGCYNIAIISLAMGIFIFIISRFIQKWMHGVK